MMRRGPGASPTGNRREADRVRSSVGSGGGCVRCPLWLVLVLPIACAYSQPLAQSFAQPVVQPCAQEDGLSAAPAAPAESDEADPQAQPGTPQPASGQPAGQSRPAAPPDVPVSKQQPKRILGIMPNYRAVSAGAIPPPPSPKEAFMIATRNSFDYSAFIVVGGTSALAEWADAHPALGEGAAGYGRYYWRGFLDKTDSNYLVTFALPTIFHQDERYYAKGEGGILKRGVYAASRILITPDYHGHNSFNASEVFGRAMVQGVSAAYYPSSNRTLGALAVKYGWAMGRNAVTNVFREFWPDIATHVLHRHP